MGNAMAGEGIHVIDICILVVESKKTEKKPLIFLPYFLGGLDCSLSG